MPYRFIHTAAIAAALLLLAGPSLASDKKSEAPGGSASSTEKGGQAQKPAAQSKNKAAPAPVKLVDLNSAGKAELMKLPGIGAAEADKIIAGRPFPTKARLVTNNIIPFEVYDKLKHQVIARQK